MSQMMLEVLAHFPVFGWQDSCEECLDFMRLREKRVLLYSYLTNDRQVTPSFLTYSQVD